MILRKQIAGMNQHYQNYSLEYFFESQKRAGIESVELWMGYPHIWVGKELYPECRKIEKMAHTRGIGIVSATIPSMAYQYQYAPENKMQREKGREYFQDGIRAAESLGCRIVSVNSGWGRNDRDREESLKICIDFLREAAEFAALHHITLVMESLKKSESNLGVTAEQIKEIWERIGHPNLKIMIDTIAVWDSGESVQEWFDIFGDEIQHMHFLDGSPDFHNPWGWGNRSLYRELECLEKNNYRGYLVQEIVGERYCADPRKVDMEYMQYFSQFIHD